MTKNGNELMKCYAFLKPNMEITTEWMNKWINGCIEWALYNANGHLESKLEPNVKATDAICFCFILASKKKK